MPSDVTSLPESYVIACLAHGAWERALRVIDELGALPAYAPHLAAAAARLREAGRHPEALAVARRATELDPGFAPGWRGCGLALARVGDLAGAEEMLLRAVTLEDEDVPS